MKDEKHFFIIKFDYYFIDYFLVMINEGPE